MHTNSLKQNKILAQLRNGGTCSSANLLARIVLILFLFLSSVRAADDVLDLNAYVKNNSDLLRYSDPALVLPLLAGLPQEQINIIAKALPPDRVNALNAYIDQMPKDGVLRSTTTAPNDAALKALGLDANALNGAPDEVGKRLLQVSSGEPIGNLERSTVALQAIAHLPVARQAAILNSKFRSMDNFANWPPEQLEEALVRKYLFVAAPAAKMNPRTAAALKALVAKLPADKQGDLAQHFVAVDHYHAMLALPDDNARRAYYARISTFDAQYVSRLCDLFGLVIPGVWEEDALEKPPTCEDPNADLAQQLNPKIIPTPPAAGLPAPLPTAPTDQATLTQPQTPGSEIVQTPAKVEAPKTAPISGRLAYEFKRPLMKYEQKLFARFGVDPAKNPQVFQAWREHRLALMQQGPGKNYPGELSNFLGQLAKNPSPVPSP